MLTEARMSLIEEFMERSGSDIMEHLNSKRNKLYEYKAQIEGLALSLDYLHTEEAREHLLLYGISVMDGSNLEHIRKRVVAMIKQKEVRYADTLKQYNEIVNKDNEKPTKEVVYDQLAELSGSDSMYLGTSIKLAEYAAYLRRIKKRITNEHAKQHRPRT